MKHDIQTVSSLFPSVGDYVSAEPYGTGHINDTYASYCSRNGTQTRYIFQRINHGIFKNPAGLMDNIRRVTTHQKMRHQKEEVADLARRSLTLINANDGNCFARDAEGNYWRCYLFIEGARTYDVIESPDQAYLGAKAFGEFQKELTDIGGERLFETIPDFHHTAKRFEVFEKALADDPKGRARGAGPEIELLMARKNQVGRLVKAQEKGLIPERITHNDTKFNNVMFDEKSGEAVCVIDLDTVMPGLVLYDFGDMVRTTTSPAEEDEKDLSKVTMRLHMFDALAKGYLESAGDFLNQAEIDHLVFAGKLITMENGIRFLTDHLVGDTYFKIHRENHNLDRCRTQLALVTSIEKQEKDMEDAVRQYAPSATR